MRPRSTDIGRVARGWIRRICSGCVTELDLRISQALPGAQVVCEAAEDSSFFEKTFDGIIAIGLIFLLGAETQRKLIRRIAPALKKGGRFLFTAPTQRARWRDMLTSRESVSLGAEEYERLLSEAGLRVEGEYTDEGENHYYACVKP